MQISGFRKKYRVAGVGLVASILFASTWMACAPGALDCPNFNNCEQIGGGGTGGPRGGSGGSAGSGGSGGSPGGITAATPVVGCKYATVGAVETMLLKPKCGDPAGCHASAVPFPPDLKTANMFMRLRDVAGLSQCKTGKYVDVADPTKSYMIAKVNGTMMGAPVKCPADNAAAGNLMPFNAPPLPRDEIDCISAYSRAIAGK